VGNVARGAPTKNAGDRVAGHREDRMAHLKTRPLLTVALFAAAVALAIAPAQGQQLTKLRIAKSVTTSFPFAGLELGVEAGIWKSEGIDAEIVSFAGDARMQQAFAAGSIDVGLGSGPGMGYASKGVPAHAVAALANKPENMALVVGKNSGITSIDGLKGKRIGVTTAGSLTDWLARKIASEKGWGPNGVEVVPMGDMRTRMAAMETGDLPANVTATEQAYQIQLDGQGKVLMTFGEVVPHFHTHVLMAHDNLIKNNPDLVKRFLRAWFKVAHYMKDNKEATIKSVARTMKLSEQVIADAYDIELGMMSFDGEFDPKALELIQASLKELGIVDVAPKIEDMYVKGFTPVSIK
jgi:ABC-type nitrate/sulfonate/bicarbonate transport system substrate-binding protein